MARETVARPRLPPPYLPGPPECPDQAGHLGNVALIYGLREYRHGLHITAYNPFVGFGQRDIGEPDQGGLDPGIASGGGLEMEFNDRGNGKKGLDLFDRVQCSVIHDGVHPPS